MFTRSVDTVRKLEGKEQPLPKQLRWAVLKRGQVGHLTDNQLVALAEIIDRASTRPPDGASKTSLPGYARLVHHVRRDGVSLITSTGRVAWSAIRQNWSPCAKRCAHCKLILIACGVCQQRCIAFIDYATLASEGLLAHNSFGGFSQTSLVLSQLHHCGYVVLVNQFIFMNAGARPTRRLYLIKIYRVAIIGVYGRLTSQDLKGYRLGARQEIPQLVCGGQIVELHDGLHPPS